MNVALRGIVVAVLMAAAVSAAGRGNPEAQDPWEAHKQEPRFADVDWNAMDYPLRGQNPALGKALYARYCQMCHGEKGEGDGELADFLVPRPRNFKSGLFKGRSTHPDMPPAKMDIVRSIQHGIPLSAMLSYSFLDTADTTEIVEHVTRLSIREIQVGAEKFTISPFAVDRLKADPANPVYGKPLKSGNFHRALGMPFPTPLTISRGKALFEKYGCTVCHGEKGDGRGPQAADLVNSVDDRRSLVPDFTQGIYSGGPNTRHLYLRISAGVPGTPMAAFGNYVKMGDEFGYAVSPEDRWTLAHYVIALSQRKEPLPLPHSEKMIVTKVPVLPNGPASPVWQQIKQLPPPPKETHGWLETQPFYVLPLYFQQLRRDLKRPYFASAQVSAVHDGASISFLVEWEDRNQNPDDMMEIQFPANPDMTPGFALHGLPNEPVQLWRWTPNGTMEVDASGPFKETAQAKSDVVAKAIRAGGWCRVQWTRSLAPPGDVAISAGREIPFLLLMRDGDDGWTDDRVASEDDEDPKGNGPGTGKIDDRYKDLPRHLTTWHKMELK